MNNYFKTIILIVLFSFLVYRLVQIMGVDEPQSEIYETKKIEQFKNYDGGEKYKDVIKDLPEIDRVFVICYGVNKGYSFLEEEVKPFYNFLEDFIQLEARKLDYHEWYELLSNEMEKKRIAFYERAQKENGLIYETNTFDIYIFDNKYIHIGSNTFEVVDEDNLEEILNQIQFIVELNSNKN